jgi:hypothetical protein
VVGVFIAPTTTKWSLEVCCRMAHRTLSGAPATSASRWGSTVGALICGASGLSGGAPDRSCRLSGAPPARALTLTHTVAHLMRLQSTVAHEVVVAPLAHRTLSGDSPDSPVNYSGAPTEFPEGSEFSFKCPGAPDTIWWCTGHCLVAHRTVRCARPGCLLGCFLLSLFEPLFGLFIGLL